MWSLEVMGTVARQHAHLGFRLSETEGDTDRRRKGWSAGGGQSLCGGDEGRINMRSRCLDLATKWRLTDVARGAGAAAGWGWRLSTTSFVLSLAKCRPEYYGLSEDEHFSH